MKEPITTAADYSFILFFFMFEADDLHEMTRLIIFPEK